MAGVLAARELDIDAALLRAGRIHMVGIAGAGMRSLAELLVATGATVSGSDERFVRISGVGTNATVGHSRANVPSNGDVLIHSAAIGAENPELQQARRLGMRVISYPEAVASLTRGHHDVAIAGTHGKSTTAAMMAAILEAANLDPSTLIGAVPVGRTSGGRLGAGHFLVTEACEYRRHFLQLRPATAAILNIEADHFDCFRSRRALVAAFRRFAGRLRPGGFLLLGAGTGLSRQLTARFRGRCETFGFAASADWRASHLAHRRSRYRFRIEHRGRTVGEVTLRVPGRHNVLNALAAAALASRIGVPPRIVSEGLNQFKGVHRRLEVRLRKPLVWIDDYAHHPTEISAALKAVREMAPQRRVWCIFQPHQASRTHYLLDAFARSLQNADKLVVADIFRAREPAHGRLSVTAADLAQRARSYGAQVEHVHAPHEIKELLALSVRPGDVLVTLGAGDIGTIGNDLSQRI